MSDLIRFGGLWLNESKNGEKYMSGGFGYGGRLVIFKNDRKDKDNDPDYIVYIGAKPEKAEGQKGEEKGIPF